MLIGQLTDHDSFRYAANQAHLYTVSAITGVPRVPARTGASAKHTVYDDPENMEIFPVTLECTQTILLSLSFQAFYIPLP